LNCLPFRYVLSYFDGKRIEITKSIYSSDSLLEDNICPESTENLNNKHCYELCAPNIKIGALFGEVCPCTVYVDVKNYVKKIPDVWHWVFTLKLLLFFLILDVNFFQIPLVYMTLMYK